HIPAALAWAVLYQSHLAAAGKQMPGTTRAPVVIAPLTDASGKTYTVRQQSNAPTAGKMQTPEIPDHELLRCIGRGSYGEVWLARHGPTDFRAVKVVYRKTFEQDRPFERELSGIEQFEPISRRHSSQVSILQDGPNPYPVYLSYV